MGLTHQLISGRMLAGLLIIVVVSTGGGELLEANSSPLICHAANNSRCCICNDRNVICDDLGAVNLSFVTPYASAIETLSASRNDLYELSKNCLHGAANLSKLTLRHNKISSIDVHFFDSLTSLEFLDLSFNMLKDFYLPETSLPRLDILYLMHNSLNNIRIDENRPIGLDQLFVSHNHIGNNLEFVRNLTKARLLSLGSNNITKFQFTVLPCTPDLHSLRLSNNSISNLEFLNCTKFLWELNVSSNAIHEIPETIFSDLKLLGVLSIANNKITDSKFLNYLPSNIKLLDLSRNNLSYIQPSHLRNKTELKSIYVSHNKLKNIDFAGSVKSLETLFADNNQVAEISDELFIQQRAQKSTIVNISVSNNFITNAYFLYNLLNVNRVNLSNNDLREISDDTLSRLNKLEILDISRNKISDLHFLRNAPVLRSIHVSSNKVVNIPCDIPVEFLYLEGNNISKLQIDCLSRLRSVTMFGGIITDRKEETLRTSREVIFEINDRVITFSCFPSINTMLKCVNVCSSSDEETCDLAFNSGKKTYTAIIVIILVCVIVGSVVFILGVRHYKLRRKKLHNNRPCLCAQYSDALQSVPDSEIP